MCDYENDHLCPDEIDEDLDWDNENEDVCYPKEFDPMSQGY